MEALKKQLDDAIAKAHEGLKGYKPGTKEYASELVTIEKLSNVRIKIQNEENDSFFKDQEQKMEAQQYVETHEADLNFKEEQLKNEKKKFWLGVGTTVLTVGAYIFMGCRTTKFEETGAVTSKAFPKFPNLFQR